MEISIMEPGSVKSYRVRVNRGPFPSLAVLEEQFGGEVIPDCFCEGREWIKHPSRQGVDDSVEEVEIIVKDFTDDEVSQMGGLETENVVAWGLRNGYVPTNEKEIFAFAISPETREIRDESWLVSLGSYVDFAEDGLAHGIAVLRHSGVRLDCLCWPGSWLIGSRFLFIRRPV